MGNPLASDLDHILAHTEGLWEELRDRQLFITGGTGFFGCWILESFVWANDRLGLNAQALVLTRDMEAFRKKAPHLATHRAISFHIGDVRTFEFPMGAFSYMIDAGTPASAKLNQEDPVLMLEMIIEGTRHTLEFARRSGVKKYLFVSSGAVYGRQPSEMTHIPEEYGGAPGTMEIGSAYAEGKRLAELWCTIFHQQYGIETKIARCFAFVGPYLPLDIHFAIGNFIRDALTQKPVRMEGDGTPFRSYLYAADLAIWLWTILFRGKPCRAYNVGSSDEISILDLANMVAISVHPPYKVEVAKKPVAGRLPDRYVPSTKRAFIELGLEQKIPLAEAIRKTLSWYSAHKEQ